MNQVGLFIVGLIGLLVIGSMAGCSGEDKPPADQVTVQLKWSHCSQFAGMYIADQKGFYAEENLSVSMSEGGTDIDELTSITDENYDFAMASVPSFLVRKTQNMPIVAIAAIFQINPTVYFSLKESGIQSPHDFIGRNIWVGPNDFLLPAMMKSLSIDFEQMNIVDNPDFGRFLAGEIEVWHGYLTDQVVSARQQGHEVNVVYPHDYGIRFYNDLIVTTDTLVEENPALIERFLRATLKGWQYAIEHQDEAVAATQKMAPWLDFENELLSFKAALPLIHTGEAVLGWMDGAIWQKMQQILLDNDIIVNPVNLEEAYDMEFLNSIYVMDN